MTYAPLKKEILFKDEIKSNPRFSDAMLILKACANKDFKGWVVSRAGMLASRDINSTSFGDADRVLLTEISTNLSDLVSREAIVDDASLNQAQSLLATYDYSLLHLFGCITSFLLSVQKFERAIAAIDSNIEQAIPKKGRLTRDGNPPTNLPRSRQPTKKYGRR